MNGLAEKLKKAFGNKAYRHAFVNEFLDAAIAAQIKALREQRGWTQAELADRAGMKQSRISVMENVNYSSWSLNTLRKLARAFDVCVSVAFRSFGKTVLEIELFGPDSLEVASYPDDPIFAGQSAINQTIVSMTAPGLQVREASWARLSGRIAEATLFGSDTVADTTPGVRLEIQNA
jgi:transcriptional regulator with XRE-family HTH domain